VQPQVQFGPHLPPQGQSLPQLQFLLPQPQLAFESVDVVFFVLEPQLHLVSVVFIMYVLVYTTKLLWLCVVYVQSVLQLVYNFWMSL
jgi:hypothetical protein